MMHAYSHKCAKHENKSIQVNGPFEIYFTKLPVEIAQILLIAKSFAVRTLYS